MAATRLSASRLAHSRVGRARALGGPALHIG
jgi:hypothetical protein